MKYFSSRLLPHPTCVSRRSMIRTKRERAHHRAQLLVDGQGLPVAHKAAVGNTAGGGGGARAPAAFVDGCVYRVRSNGGGALPRPSGTETLGVAPSGRTHVLLAAHR